MSINNFEDGSLYDRPLSPVDRLSRPTSGASQASNKESSTPLSKVQMPVGTKMVITSRSYDSDSQTSGGKGKVRKKKIIETYNITNILLKRR